MPLIPQDRLALIGQLWDSLDEVDLSVTVAQRHELERRLATFEQDRRHGTAWKNLRDELHQRAR